MRLFTVGCVTAMSVVFFSGLSVCLAKQPLPLATLQQAADVAEPRAIIDQYCVTCHKRRRRRPTCCSINWILTHLGDHAEIGEKVVRKLRAGMMPPTGHAAARCRPRSRR